MRRDAARLYQMVNARAMDAKTFSHFIGGQQFHGRRIYQIRAAPSMIFLDVLQYISPENLNEKPGVSNPQAIFGSCNQISGTFVNETPQNDYFRLSVPAGQTLTALLNGLTVDYDLYFYDAAANQAASSTNGDATADQASWTNTGSSAVNIDIRVHRYSSTRTTYQLRISYRPGRARSCWSDDINYGVEFL